jgi:hypothetical protein
MNLRIPWKIHDLAQGKAYTVHSANHNHMNTDTLLPEGYRQARLWEESGFNDRLSHYVH